MDETAKIEQSHRDEIAKAADVPVEEVTPHTAETPLEFVAEKTAAMAEKTTEGGDVLKNMAEEGGSFAFGGSTTEVRPSSDWKDILKRKMMRKVGPNQELVEKE